MINVELALTGQYRAVVSKDAECRDVVNDTGWFKNLITDAGMERIGEVAVNSGANFRASFLDRVFVGTGSGAPMPTDTQLQALVASSVATTLDSQTAGYTRGYMEMVVRVQFAQGAAAGNLSEVGIGPAANNLFSRALIVNSVGVPTTITVLANEFLTVYYTLRCPIPQTDQTWSVNVDVDGVPVATTVTLRPAQANSTSTEHWTFKTTFSQTNPTSVGIGPIGDPTLSPTSNFTASTNTRQAYVAGSRQLKGVSFFSVDNGTGTFQNFAYRFGPGSWQVGFAPGLVKDNTKTLTFTIGFSWTRG